jgi:hypothetical protein
MKEGENGEVERVSPDAGLKSHTKEIGEEADLEMEGEVGEGGRPRFKEEEKLPPNYAEIVLDDPNQEILFEAELVKYKPGYSGTFVSRYIQVTETALRVYKHRAFALSVNHKPLLAIPVEAFQKVEKVNFDLSLSKKDKTRFADFCDNQFEIFLKNDFIDYYVNLEIDRQNNSPQRVPKMSRDSVPQTQNFNSISQGASTLGVPQQRPSAVAASPFKVRDLDGKTHKMNQEEMHERFVNEEDGEQVMSKKNIYTKALMQKDAWTNREEVWYFSNKRLLFSAKYPEVVDKWVESLGALVTEEIIAKEEE